MSVTIKYPFGQSATIGGVQFTAEGKTMTLCEWSRYLNRSIGYLGYWAKKYGLRRAEEVLLNDLKLIQNAQ